MTCPAQFRSNVANIHRATTLKQRGSKAYKQLRGRTLFEAATAANNPENHRLRYSTNQCHLDLQTNPRLAIHGLIRAPRSFENSIAVVPDCPMPLIIRERKNSGGSVFQVVGAAVIPELDDIEPSFASVDYKIELIWCEGRDTLAACFSYKSAARLTFRCTG